MFVQDDADKDELLRAEDEDAPRELADAIAKFSGTAQDENSRGIDFSFISEVVHLVQGLFRAGGCWRESPVLDRGSQGQESCVVPASHWHHVLVV